MDAKVQGFVSGSLPPFHSGIYEESNQEFVPNGSDASAHQGAAFSQAKHRKGHRSRDVIAHSYSPAALDFVTDVLPPEPTSQYVESTVPFIPNGSNPKAFEGSAFLQKKHQDVIGSAGMDAKVQGFVSGSLPPFHSGIYEESNNEFVPNGSDASAHQGAAFSQRHHKHHRKHKKHHRFPLDEGNIEGDISGSYSVDPMHEMKTSQNPFVPDYRSKITLDGF